MISHESVILWYSRYSQKWAHKNRTNFAGEDNLPEAGIEIGSGLRSTEQHVSKFRILWNIELMIELYVL